MFPAFRSCGRVDAKRGRAPDPGPSLGPPWTPIVFCRLARHQRAELPIVLYPEWAARAEECKGKRAWCSVAGSDTPPGSAESLQHEPRHGTWSIAVEGGKRAHKNEKTRQWLLRGSRQGATSPRWRMAPCLSGTVVSISLDDAASALAVGGPRRGPLGNRCAVYEQRAAAAADERSSHRLLLELSGFLFFSAVCPWCGLAPLGQQESRRRMVSG